MRTRCRHRSIRVAVPGGRPDAVVFDVEVFLFDAGVGIPAAKAVGEEPVRGGPATREKSRRGEREGAAAHADDRRSPVVRGAES